MLIAHWQILFDLRWVPKAQGLDPPLKKKKKIQPQASSSVWAFGSSPPWLLPWITPCLLITHIFTPSFKLPNISPLKWPDLPLHPNNDSHPTTAIFVSDTSAKRPLDCGETLAISELHSIHLRPDTILYILSLCSPFPLPSMFQSSAASASLFWGQHLVVVELVTTAPEQLDLEGKLSPSHHFLFLPKSWT